MERQKKKIIVTYKDDDTKPSSRKKQVDPRFDLAVLDVVARGDHTTFIESTVELDHNFSRSMVVDDFKFTDVTWNLEISKKYKRYPIKNVVFAVNARS